MHDEKGRIVWTQESYDHLIRSRRELANWVNYTLNNATKIGLVDDWKDFPHSYLRKGFELVLYHGFPNPSKINTALESRITLANTTSYL